MRIVIDLQGAQTGSRYRGIGRYSMALAQAVVRNKGEHEVIVTLNGLFPATIEPIRTAFEGLLPQENIRVWQPVGPVLEAMARYAWQRRVAELLREAFLASLEPDMVLVTSMFEGLGEDSVSTVGAFTAKFPTAVVLYDLIPYINPVPYLENEVVRRWYMRRLDHFSRADLWLAISESSRREGLDYLGLPPDRAVAISTAADDQFQQRALPPERMASLREKYGLSKPFVMYTGGIDHRKNIEGLIRAFALLPDSIRASHQLAIVCSVRQESRDTLEKLAAQHGLSTSDCVLTGFIPDEDLVDFYNICQLFVFPSWHEGFGLPALEAMLCGAPVIGANTSSLPEVIGLDEALFDPRDDSAIAALMEKALSDDTFRQRLIDHGLRQSKKFSWDHCAQVTLRSFEAFHARRDKEPTVPTTAVRRPRLAYVSPLPPERTGIAEYSAELLPALSRHYFIEVIVDQPEVSDSWITSNFPVRDLEWFRSNSQRYDRIVYHFGNSHFHRHMFDLLEEFPGTVVLHDFFLSGANAYREVHGLAPRCWARELYHSHGYPALARRYATKDAEVVMMEYPCNFSVLQKACGIIVHSAYSRRLAEEWYGDSVAGRFTIIPHLRKAALPADKSELRRRHNLPEHSFIVASFGLIGPTKQNHRLLDAWLASPLAGASDCLLVFAGENHAGAYGRELLEKIQSSGLAERIRITGWTSSSDFQDYLALCDVAVQLRTASRGETSGTVLDCMNHGVATIVNANGSMADISPEVVWKLPDEFEDKELAGALAELYSDASRRVDLGRRAWDEIRSRHTPMHCAELYRQAIERFAVADESGRRTLMRSVAALEKRPANRLILENVVNAIGMVLPDPHPARQLFVDVSALTIAAGVGAFHAFSRAVLLDLLESPPPGYRVEPVYAAVDKPGFRYARKFTLALLGCPVDVLEDEPIEPCSGDSFLCLHSNPAILLAQADTLTSLRGLGVAVHILPGDWGLTDSDEAGATQREQLLAVLRRADGVVCLSARQEEELQNRLLPEDPREQRPCRLSGVRFSDIKVHEQAHRPLPGNAAKVVEHLEFRPSLLMLDPIVPGNGHDLALAAFEALWKESAAVNLVIMGTADARMAAFMQNLQNHPLKGNKLIHFACPDPAYRRRLIQSCAGLISASGSDGPCVHLAEAAVMGLPLLLRDTVCFRSVAGSGAFYFDASTISSWLASIKDWLEMFKQGTHPKPDRPEEASWDQPMFQLVQSVTGENDLPLRRPAPR